MRALLLAAIFAATLLSSPSTSMAKQDSATHWRGTAVFGVDVLGRYLIAVDSTKDGVLDYYWSFTAEEYLAGPWFETSRVTIVQKARQLILRTHDGKYFVGLSMDGEPRMKSPASATRAYVYENGIQLLGTDGVPRLRESFDPMDLSAWPPGIGDADMLNPGTGGVICQPHPNWFFTEGCDAGGPGSQDKSCGVGGCGIAPTSCSVACSDPCFACCSCVNVQVDPPQTTARCGCFGTEP